MFALSFRYITVIKGENKDRAYMVQRLATGAPWLFARTVVVRDWRFLSVTIISCAVAAIVASFQYSVFTSFLRAGAVIPRTVGADFWIVGRTVECFDFPDPFSEDYAAALARYMPDAQFRRVVFGFAPWRSPSGRRGNVAIVGIDDSGLPETGFAVDRSDLGRLDLPESADSFAEASIAGTTLHLAQVVNNLPTFLGAPYVMVPFEQGRRMLRMDPNSTSFIIGNFGNGQSRDIAPLRAASDKLFPDVSLVSAGEFESSSSLYWQKKTGAGAAILLAAVLAALLMVILLANGISRFIQRYHQDLLSLLGHGASERDILSIIIMVAVLIAVVTMGAAVIVTPVAILSTNFMLPWVSFRLADMVAPVAAIAGALLFAILSAQRAVSAYGPETVFRS
jgi:hypothetical protein